LKQPNEEEMLKSESFYIDQPEMFKQLEQINEIKKENEDLT